MTREEAIAELKRDIELDNDFTEDYLNAVNIAIKALEQEPCNDTVSRKAVLNTLDKRFDSIPVGQTTEILLLRKDLRELPPVTPTGWITVIERMPKPNETEHMIAKYYLVQNEYGDMMVARWDGKGWKQMYQPNSYLEDDVIAWMPLPSLYELQESEED